MPTAALHPSSPPAPALLPLPPHGLQGPLIARAQAGDRAALTQVYEDHVDRVWGYVFMTVRNRDEADELTHDVFVRMLERIGDYEYRSVPFAAWLLRIARNLALDRVRRKGYAVVDAPEHEDAPVVVSSSETEALRLMTGETLTRALDRLPEAQRQTLLLRFVSDLSLRDTAVVMGRTVGAIKLLQQRALAKLAADGHLLRELTAGDLAA